MATRAGRVVPGRTEPGNVDNLWHLLGGADSLVERSVSERLPAVSSGGNCRVSRRRRHVRRLGIRAVPLVASSRALRRPHKGHRKGTHGAQAPKCVAPAHHGKPLRRRSRAHCYSRVLLGFRGSMVCSGRIVRHLRMEVLPAVLTIRGPLPNSAFQPPHSRVTALANGSKRRSAGRARQAHR